MLLASTAAQCCRLCAIARGMPQAQGVDRPWLLDENYAAFVSVGALVPGWSLVAPKQHGFNLSTYYSKNSFWQFVDRAVDVVERTYRSEEHTSELQSLMRISYAVFCLK